MIRLTLRQFRIQAAVAIVGLLAVAIVVAITGPALTHLYDTTVANCRPPSNCQAARTAFLAKDAFLRNALSALVFVVPALIGIFWGAPLIARELETGTFRLAWTQSVSRARWLTVKLGVVGISGILAAGLFSLAVTLWYQPIDTVTGNQYAWHVFDVRDVVPIGYAAFAFALAALAGAVIRRTVPAMAATAVGFVGARVAFTHWIRPILVSAAHTDMLIGGSAAALGFQADSGGHVVDFVAKANIPGGWSMSTGIADRAGQLASRQTVEHFLARSCPQIATPPARSGGPGTQQAPPGAFNHCISLLSARFHLAVTYQPPGHYWSFQWLEMGIYVVAGLVLLGACFWWCVRRLPERGAARRVTGRNGGVPPPRRGSPA